LNESKIYRLIRPSDQTDQNYLISSSSNLFSSHATKQMWSAVLRHMRFCWHHQEFGRRAHNHG